MVEEGGRPLFFWGARMPVLESKRGKDVNVLTY